MQKTPNQKRIDKIVHYRKRCESVLKLSKSIRYVGLINEYGTTLTGILRPGLKTLLSRESARSEFFLVSTFLTMRNRASSSLGRMSHMILKYEKITVVIFQRREGIYYISVNASSTPEIVNNIITKIKKVI